MKNNSKAILTILAVGLLAGPVSAQVMVTPQSSTASESAFDSQINTNGDLVLNQPFTLVAGITASGYTAGQPLGPEGGAGSHIIDGLASTGNLHTNTALFLSDGIITNGTLDADPTFTVALNTVASPLGYNLSSIETFYGYQDHGTLADQSYSVYFSTVTAPTVFNLLTTVNYAPIDPSAGNVGDSASSLVTLTNLTAATGVADVRLVLTPYFNGSSVEQAGQDLRELEVFGTAVPVVPEPSTYAMMLGGLGVLVLVSRLRYKAGEKAMS